MLGDMIWICPLAPGTSVDVLIWDGYGPSRTRGDFFDFEVGGHDGAYKGRIHVIGGALSALLEFRVRVVSFGGLVLRDVHVGWGVDLHSGFGRTETQRPCAVFPTPRTHLCPFAAGTPRASSTPYTPPHNTTARMGVPRVGCRYREKSNLSAHSFILLQPNAKTWRLTSSRTCCHLTANCHSQLIIKPRQPTAAVISTPTFPAGLRTALKPVCNRHKTRPPPSPTHSCPPPPPAPGPATT